MRLWYKNPAVIWEEALPVGNGRLGGMVFGGVERERIQLNADTLWSGAPGGDLSSDAPSHMETVRKLILDKKYAQAEKIIDEKMLGNRTKKYGDGQMLGRMTQAYEPLGNLYIESFTHLDNVMSGYKYNPDTVSDYVRELNLETAVAKTKFTRNGVGFLREVFVSGKDGVLIVRIEGDRPKSIHINVGIDSPMPHKVFGSKYNSLILSGRCPTTSKPAYCPTDIPVLYEEDKESITFTAEVRVHETDGEVYSFGGTLQIKKASYVTLSFSAGTSFNGFDAMPVSEGKDDYGECMSYHKNIRGMDYDTLKNRHIEDYQSLYKRVDLKLGTPNDGLDIPERIIAMQEGQADDNLLTLLFQYGRYLTIASSREGTQPANLQGIWNQEVRPPWSSNYTLNINAQMNYWHVGTCNLPECHQPFLKMIEELSVTGEKVAKTFFNAPGWVTNHNSDIWRFAQPVSGSARFAFWPMGGAWSCRHLWEHYLHTGDIDFLRERAYPIMKSAAIFLLDWLVEDDGLLITVPSTSPENAFLAENNEMSSCGVSSAMDISIIQDLFGSCIEASSVLKTDENFAAKLLSALKKLAPLEIGDDGRLKEWPMDYAESEKGHRHLSHLYGIYPANTVTGNSLLEAAKKSLEFRTLHGSGLSGWSCTWIVSLAARFKDDSLAYEFAGNAIRRSVYPNLLSAHPPFQIDGNFGFTAGICEMLLQSHNGYIELLPCLPKSWDSGSFSGLVARGGFEIDAHWGQGKAKFNIRSKNDGNIRLKYPGISGANVKSSNSTNVFSSVEDGQILSFPSEKGLEYTINVNLIFT